MLNANLPKAVNAQTNRVQESSATVLALEERPESAQETAEEESLGRKEATGQILLEEADAGPAGANSTGDKEGHAKDGLGKAVEGGEWRVDEGLVPGKRQDAENDGKETRNCGESLDVVGDVCTGARGVMRVKESAGKVLDGRVSGRGDRRDGRQGAGKGRLIRKHDRGNERTVDMLANAAPKS